MPQPRRGPGPARPHLRRPPGYSCAGSPQTAREYFTDLRIPSAIALASWPPAREFNPAPLAKAVEHHLTTHRREIDALPGELRQHTWDRPPKSAIASGVLLHTADQILALDQHDRDEALRSMLRSGPGPDSGKWGRTDLHLFHASLSFRSAVMQARDRRSQNLARGPSSRLDPNSYRPEHIPQWLPDHWLQYPNGDLLAPRLRHPMQRRAAAVRLIQMVSDMGVQAAARFLGIPDTWPERRAGNQRLPIALFLNDREIELLANQISDTTTGPLSGRRSLRGPGTTPPFDNPWKHQAASEFVWSRVTGSERALAPLIPALPPQLRHRRHWGSMPTVSPRRV
ncbi:hypothetical protein [Streptomyces sp. NPDC054834]